MDRGGRPLNVKDFVLRGTDREELFWRLGLSGREDTHFQSAEIVVVFRNPAVFEHQLGKAVKPSVVFDLCWGPLNEQDFLFTRSDSNVRGISRSLGISGCIRTRSDPSKLSNLQTRPFLNCTSERP